MALALHEKNSPTFCDSNQGFFLRAQFCHEDASLKQIVHWSVRVCAVWISAILSSIFCQFFSNVLGVALAEP